MNDKKIITQIERNYIETLYLNFNIENASDNEADHSTMKYYNVMHYIADMLLPSGKYLSYADGRTWYQFKNYRMGIMSYDKAKIANQFNCVIQYEQHHLWELDEYLNGLDLPFDVDKKHYHIKRIDITKIAKHKEDYTINHGYLSPYREYSYFKGTHYLGDRKNGNVFRIYNKTKELMTDTKEHPINYKKIALMSEYFGDIEDLYTYELELHRKYLKGSLGIETLADLSKIYSVYKNIVGKIRFYKDNDKNKRLIKQNNTKRIKARILTDYIDFERIEKKVYKPSYAYHLNTLKKEIRRYLDSGIEKNEINYYMRMFTELTQDLDIDGKELTFNFETSDLMIEKAQMTAKYDLLRANQGNDLEIEARRHFGKFVSRKEAVVEIEV